MNETETQETERTARLDWERRIYTRLTDTAVADPATALPAPTGVTATPARGHVHLSWEPVAGAAGYLIERTDRAGTEPRIVAHGGSDVPAVPECEFADTGLQDGTPYSYRIGAVAGAEFPAWNWSDPVSAATSTAAVTPVRIKVDSTRETGRLNRVWYMAGSERLTQLRFGPDASGHDIGTEFAEALRIVHEDLGVTYVRAHAILHDDNHVVTRDADGSLTYDFAEIDALYDQILQAGVRPIVELSFMPAALAADPEATVFGYRGIISPPRDWSEWHDLVAALTRHLVERYGLDEVRQWGFEVWNEPNLVVFWTGTQDEYLRLYEESARAVRTVDDQLPVGGPSTAATEWVEALASFCEKHRLPLDFVSTHTYGNVPLDTRPALDRHGFGAAKIYWTEWGVGSTHYGPIHDGVIGAPFILRGYHGVQDRMDALAYWVFSDHFEELGRPPRLFHNGFGLLTVGNLRKPRYWAVHLAAHQGDTVLATTLDGDGAGVLVQASATRHDDGTIDVLVWNGTINGALMDGDPRLERTVAVEIGGLGHSVVQAEVARIDETHSNIKAGYRTVVPDGVDWPDEEQFARLRELDVLHTERLEHQSPQGGVMRVELQLPMPGVVRLRLTGPARANEENAR